MEGGGYLGVLVCVWYKWMNYEARLSGEQCCPHSAVQLNNYQMVDERRENGRARGRDRDYQREVNVVETMIEMLKTLSTEEAQR